MITFVIPSLGRATLMRAIDSLRAQSDPDWKAVVAFDGVEPTIISDDKISMIKVNPRGEWRAGLARNAAIETVTTPWVGLLDDDDTLHPDYVKTHKKMSSGNETVAVFLYKMLNQDGRILPDVPALRCNHVGISFAFHKRVFERVRFKRMKCEDLDFLCTARSLGYPIKFVDAILYKVKQ